MTSDSVNEKPVSPESKDFNLNRSEAGARFLHEAVATGAEGPRAKSKSLKDLPDGYPNLHLAVDAPHKDESSKAPEVSSIQNFKASSLMRSESSAIEKASPIQFKADSTQSAVNVSTWHSGETSRSLISDAVSYSNFAQIHTDSAVSLQSFSLHSGEIAPPAASVDTIAVPGKSGHVAIAENDPRQLQGITIPATRPEWHGTDSTKSLSLLNSLDASIHLENNVSAHMIDSANINALDHMSAMSMSLHDLPPMLGGDHPPVISGPISATVPHIPPIESPVPIKSPASGGDTVGGIAGGYGTVPFIPSPKPATPVPGTIGGSNGGWHGGIDSQGGIIVKPTLPTVGNDGSIKPAPAPGNDGSAKPAPQASRNDGAVADKPASQQLAKDGAVVAKPTVQIPNDGASLAKPAPQPTKDGSVVAKPVPQTANEVPATVKPAAPASLKDSSVIAKPGAQNTTNDISAIAKPAAQVAVKDGNGTSKPAAQTIGSDVSGIAKTTSQVSTKDASTAIDASSIAKRMPQSEIVNIGTNNAANKTLLPIQNILATVEKNSKAFEVFNPLKNDVIAGASAKIVGRPDSTSTIKQPAVIDAVNAASTKSGAGVLSNMNNIVRLTAGTVPGRDLLITGNVKSAVRPAEVADSAIKYTDKSAGLNASTDNLFNNARNNANIIATLVSTIKSFEAFTTASAKLASSENSASKVYVVNGAALAVVKTAAAEMLTVKSATTTEKVVSGVLKADAAMRILGSIDAGNKRLGESIGRTLGTTLKSGRELKTGEVDNKKTEFTESNKDVLLNSDESAKDGAKPISPALVIAVFLSMAGISKNSGERAENESQSEESESESESEPNQSNIPLLRRRTHLLESTDTLLSVAEKYFSDSRVGWLIADLNRALSTEHQVGQRRVVELQSRQALVLPEAAEVNQFLADLPRKLDVEENLITVVVDTVINQEVVGQLGIFSMDGAASQRKPVANANLPELIIA